MDIAWPNPWRLVDDRRRAYIGGELSWELSHFPEHPLATRSFTVIAMLDAYDNAIIRLEDGEFGYVHLAWNAQQPPHFEPIGDEEALRRFLRPGTAVE